MPTKRISKIPVIKRPTLGLSAHERAAFRSAMVLSRDVASLGGEALHKRLAGSLSRVRCDEIASLADFQGLGSVGLETARDFIALGFSKTTQLRGQDPRTLYARMCEISNSRQDPCVEDAFRCAIAQAEDRNLPGELRNWWRWTSVRGQPMRARP